MNEINIYTTGTYSTATQKGGWGVLIQQKLADKQEHKIQTILGSDTHTTNNLMKLQALIESLKALNFNELSKYKFFLDSHYLMLSLRNREKYENTNFSKVQNAEKLQELYRVLDSKDLKLNNDESLTIKNFLVFNEHIQFIHNKQVMDNFLYNQCKQLATKAKCRE